MSNCIDADTLQICVSGENPIVQTCGAGETCRVDACEASDIDACQEDGAFECLKAIKKDVWYRTYVRS